MGAGVGWGPLLPTWPIPSNLGQHFTLISCRARGSSLWGPLGCCGGPSSPGSGEEITTLPPGTSSEAGHRQGTGREPTCRRCCKPTRSLSRWTVLKGGAHRDPCRLKGPTSLITSQAWGLLPLELLFCCVQMRLGPEVDFWGQYQRACGCHQGSPASSRSPTATFPSPLNKS